MADLADLASVLGGAASGGIFGLLGSLGTMAGTFIAEKQKAKDEREGKKIDYDHALAMAQINREAASQEQTSARILEQLRNEGAEQLAAFQLVQATIADQSQLNSRASQWVVDTLTLVRPVLTLLLILIALWFGATRNPNAFYQSIFMATMAVTWWFGDRQQLQNRTSAKQGIK